jgi:(p)ppGpp synthase/HD superfamily hydrolase
MKLSNSISQEPTLQLAVSIALDQGVEEVHEMVKSHENDLSDARFIKEITSWMVKANKPKYFYRGLPPDQFLKNNTVLLEKALLMAANRHKGEYRDSGNAYLAHVISTGFVLARLGLHQKVVISGILHDTVEDTHHKTRTLNALYDLDPSVAFNVYSVSGPDIVDAVEKDAQLHARIQAASTNTGSIFPKIIKCADAVANLYDIEFMKAKDGRTSEERQMLFISKIEKQIIPYAQEIDKKNVFPIKKNHKTFSLAEYITDYIREKKQE